MSNDQPIHDALEGVLERAKSEARELHLEKTSLIVFSDLHRGIRNRADDFAAAEEAYLRALQHYHAAGYTLLILGDAEELWQERPEKVLSSYKECLALERRFHENDRYLRLWGNHDDLWESPEAVREHLQPQFGKKPLHLYESLLFRVYRDKQELGELLFLHGHQGSKKSDRWSGVLRVAIRYLYRPFQRLTGLSLDTPSKNPRLREEHNKTLQAWAARHERLVLVAGHTHRPVFRSRSDAAQGQRQLEAVQAKLEEAPHDEALEAKAESLKKALAEDHDYAEGGVRRSYFNTGCCCYPGGDITGLEVAEEEFKLVHWSAQGEEQPQVLGRASITQVFGAAA
jgi:UDP-2,3-diacylglucosamine pyrophosphatase LpxH